MELAHYRVNANIGDLRHGEVVAIDPEHPYWRSKIDKGYLRPEPDPALHMDEFDAPASQHFTADDLAGLPTATLVDTDDDLDAAQDAPE